jgi:hypothetical protein
MKKSTIKEVNKLNVALEFNLINVEQYKEYIGNLIRASRTKAETEELNTLIANK